jgi:hypothetical protein
LEEKHGKGCNKVLIKKLHDENEELKGSITWAKSEDEELQNSK